MLKAQLEMMEQEVFQVPWVLQVLQAPLEKRVNLVLEVWLVLLVPVAILVLVAKMDRLVLLVLLDPRVPMGSLE